MNITGQTFKNQEIRLDFIRYEKCVFEKCTLIYSGYGPVVLQYCTFIDVLWVLTDAAQNTIQFMRAMYQGTPGGKQVIDPFLQIITDKNVSDNRPLTQSVSEQIALA